MWISNSPFADVFVVWARSDAHDGKIRGFEPNGLGPRDLAAPNEDALGGNYFWALRTELQFPLGLPEEYGITGGLFRLDSRVCADS